MLLLGLLVYAMVELAVFVLVAGQIGVLAAFGLLVVVSALGPFVLRRVGVSVLARTRDRLERGELPTAEVLDGLVVFVAGVLVSVPGFVGDAVGLALMLGPVRRLAIRLAGHRIARKLRTSQVLRWRVVEVRSRPRPGPGAPPTYPPDGPAGGANELGPPER